MGGGVEGSVSRPGRLYPRERPGTHFTGGWVDPRAGLDGRKISPHRDFFFFKYWTVYLAHRRYIVLAFALVFVCVCLSFVCMKCCNGRIGRGEFRCPGLSHSAYRSTQSRTVQPVAQSLYQLSYPANVVTFKQTQFCPSCPHGVQCLATPVCMSRHLV